MQIVLNNPTENVTLNQVKIIKLHRVEPNLNAGTCYIVVRLLDEDGKTLGTHGIREKSKLAVDAMIAASTSTETMTAAIYDYLQSTFGGTIVFDNPSS